MDVQISWPSNYLPKNATDLLFSGSVAALVWMDKHPIYFVVTPLLVHVLKYESAEGLLSQLQSRYKPVTITWEELTLTFKLIDVHSLYLIPTYYVPVSYRILLKAGQQSTDQPIQPIFLVILPHEPRVLGKHNSRCSAFKVLRIRI